VLHLRKGDTFDRFQLVEDIVTGQRIRNYTIAIHQSSPEDSRGGASPQVLVHGDAIGQKRIHLLCVTHCRRRAEGGASLEGREGPVPVLPRPG
jgi:hypothetical protein